ncbi:M28 family metallopeptidase [Dactylosporangium sp. NBC_01737]|uniref:M28 family metallopeptidase n=1 Tax=Dactylosporangium sp. NBC_01737 TaxID=2975959 RepID=UPI002E0E15AB|nr:M28 family metallopeptidase [Dactylosporangium sp. NBC_01737]
MSAAGRPTAADALGGLLDAVSGERMAATVAALAGAPFTGRRVGSAGGAAARAWLAQHLADLGATVTLEPFAVRFVPEVYTTPDVQWYDGGTVRRLAFGRDVAVHLASADQPLIRRGDLAVAGSGDPTGRWLVVPPGMTLFGAYGHANGAIGLLFGRGVDADGWHYTMLAGPNPGPLPILTLDAATHAALHAVAESGGWLAGNAPIRRLDVAGTNLHGTWHAGTGVEVLLTAHYDGVGDHPGLRQPAAADNGSGVAVVLEAARVLARHLPDNTRLSVALLDGEEAGALGSAHHAAQLRTTGATPLVINVDGAGNLHQAAAVEAGGPAHALLAALDQAGRHTGLPLVAGPVASDNRRYAAVGFPAVGIGAGMAGYHSPADTADRVETSTLAAVARLVVATGWLATADPATLQSLIGDKR